MIKQLGEQYELKRELIKNSAEVLERRLKFVKNCKPSKEEVEEPITEETEEKPKINIPSGDLNFITDENLYKEIVNYMDKTFPAYTSTLSGKLSFDGVMKGSNPYIATAVDMFFKSINDTHRIATQKDLETNLEMFRGFYEDTGLVLRSLNNPNNYKAKYLYEQLGKANSTLPIFFDLRGLKLDANLNFNLTEESRYKTANCLNWKNVTSYSKMDEFGLPKEKDENSSRQIWTCKDGLVRLYLGGNFNLDSYTENLRNFYDYYGRIILVKPSQNLQKQKFSNSELKTASFLSNDDLGKEIHSSIMTKYSDIEVINRINLGMGSNPFYVVAVNEFLRQKYPNLRTATQADLEKILNGNFLELKGHYENSGLVLRTQQDPNQYLAKDLFKQFKLQGKTLKENSAYVLWLHNLSLRKDSNSPHGVSFVIPNKFVDYFEAPILNEVSSQKFESFEVDVSTGIPKKVFAKGSKTLYTRNSQDYSIKNSGIGWLCFECGLGLSSNYVNLGGFSHHGRVVLVKLHD